MPFGRFRKIGTAGVFVVVLSILYQSAIFPAVLKWHVKKRVALKVGWPMREIWGRYIFPSELRFYIFNVTNVGGIHRGEKPVLHEVGPFVYDVWEEKTNQVDHEEDDTVSYGIKSTFHFNAEKSNGLSDAVEVMIPHLFIIGTANALMRDKPGLLGLVAKAIDGILKEPESVFMKTQAKNLLFDGLLIDCRELADFASSAVCSDINENYFEYLLVQKEPRLFATSILGGLNATDRGKRTRIVRGSRDLADIGRVVEYANKRNMSTWKDDHCDAFNGTDGTRFQPFLKKNGKSPLGHVHTFFCRSIPLKYDSTVKYSGLKLLRYTEDLGTDGMHNPDDQCYCLSPDSCLRRGVFDLYKCSNTPPTISNPHLYLADPFYSHSVIGLHPDKSKHLSMMDIDPMTGLAVRTYSRIQMNLFLYNLEKFHLMNNYPDALLPIAWIERVNVLPDYYIKEIKSIYAFVVVHEVFAYLFMSVGLGVCAFAGYREYRSSRKDKINRQVVQQNSSGNNGTSSNTGDKRGQITVSAVQQDVMLPNID